MYTLILSLKQFIVAKNLILVLDLNSFKIKNLFNPLYSVSNNWKINENIAFDGALVYFFC